MTGSGDPQITARFLPVWRVSVPDGAAGRIVTAYLEDRPIEEITTRFEISKRTLYRLLDEKGIPLRCSGRGRKPSDVPDAQIVAAYVDGEPCSEIVARYGIGLDRLYRLLRLEGVPLRNR